MINKVDFRHTGDVGRVLSIAMASDALEMDPETRRLARDVVSTIALNRHPYGLTAMDAVKIGYILGTRENKNEDCKQRV